MPDDIATTELEQALDALEVWKQRTGDRDRLVRRARSKGATLDAIGQRSGIAKKTIQTILNEQETPVPMNTTDDRLAGLHHPHFVRDLGPDVPPPRFTFRPFTGAEAQPSTVMPLPPAETDGRDLVALRDEGIEADHEWQTARFEAAARPVLEAARPVYRLYRNQMEDLTAAAEALFTSTVDNMWKAGAAALYDNQQAAVEIAERWDEKAAELAALEEAERAKFDFRDKAPGLDEVAARIGINIMDWPLRTATGTPTADKVRAHIEAQNRKLRAVVTMTGDNTEADPQADSARLHTAIEYMVDNQAVRVHPDSRAKFMAVTDPMGRATLAVNLYAGLEPRWRGNARPEDITTVTTAYDIAARMVEAAKTRHHGL